MTDIESQIFVDASAALNLMSFELLSLDVQRGIELCSQDRRGDDQLYDGLLDAADELRNAGMNLLAGSIEMLAERVAPRAALVESRGSECLECGEPARYR